MTTYNADLRIPPTETFGPKLNSRSVAILHPDMYQTSQNTGRTRIAQREVDRSAYLPDEHLCNLVLKDINTLDSNGNLVARATTETQKVGPATPLAAVAPKTDPFVSFVETVDTARIAYLNATYGHTTSGTTNVAAPGTSVEDHRKILFHT